MAWIREFLYEWGNLAYLVILVWTFFEGETVLIVAGVLAQQKHLSLEICILAAFVGSFCGDQTWFHLGRFFGHKWMARGEGRREKVEKVLRLVRRNDVLFILSFRFVYGVRNVAPMAIALSGVPYRRFFWLNMIAAALWAVSFGSIGYLFADVIEQTLGEIESVKQLLLVILAVVGGLMLIGRLVYLRIMKMA